MMTLAQSLQDVEQLARESEGMSARDLKAICEVVERGWVAAIVHGREAQGSLPPLSAYLASALARRAAMKGTAASAEKSKSSFRPGKEGQHQKVLWPG
jgi:hypothetical protein